jgi:orotidine-5'-phosphate decarboxylase
MEFVMSGRSVVHFADRLTEAVRRVGNAICVGIDPRPEDLPPGLLDRFPEDRGGVAAALDEFGRAVIDVVAGKVGVVKFQSAYYEAYGPEGLAALKESIAYARSRGLLVIFDGKRNDIGSTAEAYARAYLGKVPVGGRFEPVWDADAITVNPYLGADGVTPFIKVAAREGKGIFALVRTSNASAREFQDLIADGKPVYRHVAERLAGWAAPHLGQSGYSLAGAVVGATYPAELAELRAAMPGIIFLVPGYGTQGGSGADVAAAFDENGLGAIINNSRGLIFAYSKQAYKTRFANNWQGAVEAALDEMIADLDTHTPSSKLRG